MSKKTMTRYDPTQPEKLAALSHVFYEIEQLLFLLSPRPQDQLPPDLLVARNAWLEATLLHVRLLLDFFEKSERSKRKDVENDDVLACDFGFIAQPITIPPTIRERLNKDLAHLTYSRQKRTSAEKAWDLAALRQLFERAGHFSQHIVTDWCHHLSTDSRQQWERLSATLNSLKWP